jgi:hypothetical protein
MCERREMGVAARAVGTTRAAEMVNVGTQTSTESISEGGLE